MSRVVTKPPKHYIGRLYVKAAPGLLVWIILGTLWIGSSSVAKECNFMASYKEPNELEFTAGFTHYAFSEDVAHRPHFFKLDKGDEKWMWFGTIAESGLEDKLNWVHVNISAGHFGHPHENEKPENDNHLAWSKIITSAKNAYSAGFHEFGPIDVKAPHEDGQCVEQGTLTGNVLVSKDHSEILAYALSIVGHHPKDRKQAHSGGGGVVPEEPTDSAFGVASWLVSPSTGDLLMGISIMNLSLGKIIAAHWRLGTPEMPGPIIYDLVAELFEAVDTLGVDRSISGGSFPLEYIDSLTAERTYLEIETTDGFLRGQMLMAVEGPPPPPPPRRKTWLYVVLAGVLLVVIALYIWRRKVAVRGAA